MTVEDIIKEVRWCVDCESRNTSAIADKKDDIYLDNIIKSKINDALHWLAVTATSSPHLDGQAGSKDNTSLPVTMQKLTVNKFDEIAGTDDVGYFTMPDDMEVVSVNRVRCKGWHKAVVPTEDTADAALMMFDETARGTADRPQAVSMNETTLKILVQPMATSVVVSFVGVPKNVDTTDESTDVAITDKLRSAFIYYLAFLLLSSYGDSNARTMYNIALQHLGASAQTSS